MLLLATDDCQLLSERRRQMTLHTLLSSSFLAWKLGSVFIMKEEKQQHSLRLNCFSSSN